MSDCRICNEVGGPLPRCACCGKTKKPRGRSAALETCNSYCDHECPGYHEEPLVGELWPNERYGDSLGHMKWHEEPER